MRNRDSYPVMCVRHKSETHPGGTEKAFISHFCLLIEFLFSNMKLRRGKLCDYSAFCLQPAAPDQKAQTDEE